MYFDPKLRSDENFKNGSGQFANLFFVTFQSAEFRSVFTWEKS